MSSIESLSYAWLLAKKKETEAIDHRRKLEDEIAKELRIAKDLDGTANFETKEFKVKVVGRLTQKVDSAKLQELAAEHGLTDALPHLFRWEPKLNVTLWKATDESITKPLLGAITTTPGRPSFSITTKE